MDQATLENGVTGANELTAPEHGRPNRIGRIVAVTGAHAVIMLDGQVANTGEDMKSPEIGTLLRVETASTITLALVSALSAPTPSHDLNEVEVRIVEVEFIGELPVNENGEPAGFRRGVSNYPGLGDIVSRASRMELAKAYACDADTAIRVGHIQQDKTIPAMVKLDDMLGKHFAVLGTTGTGKSCSVALIMRRILEKNPQAHILLLDVHREYAASFMGVSEVIKPDNMQLPFWLLNFEEIAEILIGYHAHRETDTEILRELIPQAKVRYTTNQRRERAVSRAREQAELNNIGIDTPIPYRTSDLIGLLDEHIGKLELKGGLAPYKRIKAKLEVISRDPRYAFMFGNLTVQDNMADVLGRLFRIPVDGKPITILELGGLPSEIINVVVSVLARLAFDFGLYSAGRIPITFVCEEAHRYVPIDKSMGFEPTKRAISRIAKEGRKYGVSLCMVTQRPAELDPTILSQCNTIFSLRLTNERDQDILKAGVSDAAASLMDFMPTMGAGEAVTFGEGVALPTRIKFDLLPKDELPRSNTASFTINWSRDLPPEGFLNSIVSRWRSQNLPSPEEAAAAQAMHAEEWASSQNLQDQASLDQPAAAEQPSQPQQSNGLHSPPAMGFGQQANAGNHQPSPQAPMGQPQSTTGQAQQNIPASGQSLSAADQALLKKRLAERRAREASAPATPGQAQQNQMPPTQPAAPESSSKEMNTGNRIADMFRQLGK